MIDGRQGQEHDAARAVEIVPTEGRDAHAVAPSSNDNELNRQVEQQPAGHSPAATRDGSDRAADTAGSVARNRPRSLGAATLVLSLLMAAAAAAGTGAAVWALGKEQQARQSELAAVEKLKRTEQAATDCEDRFAQAEALRLAAQKERDQSHAAVQQARDAAEEKKAVLAFLETNLLSASAPGDGSLTGAFWAGGRGKDVTLHKAVDAAESQVAVAFAARPIAEARAREMLAAAYMRVGDPADAVKQLERALAVREAMQGPDNPDTAACRNQLAVAYRHADNPDAAARLFAQNPISPSRAAALAVSGSIMLAQHKPAEAELKLRECLAIRQEVQPDDWTTFETKSLLGEALLDQRKFAEADPLLVAGYEGMKQHEKAIPPRDKTRVTQAVQRLVRNYEAWGKPEKAAEWRTKVAAPPKP